EPVACDARRSRLDLELGHVDAGGTFALASLAGDAQIERGANALTGQVLAVELTAKREAQCVGAPAGGVLLVARHGIAGAHRPRIELAAVTVVVAHLDGLGETVRYVSAGARCRLDAGQRIALNIPCRPVELRCERSSPIVAREAEQRRIVHLRRIDDL